MLFQYLTERVGLRQSGQQHHLVEMRFVLPRISLKTARLVINKNQTLARSLKADGRVIAIIIHKLYIKE